MKKKKSSTQQQQVVKMIQEGITPSFANYALEKADKEVAESLAKEIGIPFQKIEQILVAYHNAKIDNSEITDKQVAQVLEKVLVQGKQATELKGLFQTISKTA